MKCGDGNAFLNACTHNLLFGSSDDAVSTPRIKKVTYDEESVIHTWGS